MGACCRCSVDIRRNKHRTNSDSEDAGPHSPRCTAARAASWQHKEHRVAQQAGFLHGDSVTVVLAEEDDEDECDEEDETVEENDEDDKDKDEEEVAASAAASQRQTAHLLRALTALSRRTAASPVAGARRSSVPAGAFVRMTRALPMCCVVSTVQKADDSMFCGLLL